MFTKLILQNICFILALGGVAAISARPAERGFPVPRGSTALELGDWVDSPMIAVGEVTNAVEYGRQEGENFPWPMSPSVHTLYWCVGDFDTVAVLKVPPPPPGKKYLWATRRPGCQISKPGWVKSAAWFLREEGEFLRPVFDYGSYYFLGLRTAWKDGPPLPPRERFGALLLTLEMLEPPPDYIWTIGDIACDLLGGAECTRRITELMATGSSEMRKQASNFLICLYDEACDVMPHLVPLPVPVARPPRQ
jgi:hypothetical protein